MANSNASNSKSGSDSKITLDSEQGILEIKRVDQYKTVDELVSGSQPNSAYYWMLTFSTIIIAAGLLLNNSSIVVGGMIVTPVLTPILVISLYLAIGELHPLRAAGILLIKSFAIILGISIALTIAFGAPSIEKFLFLFEDKTTTTLLYLMVAVASGVIATIGLTRKDVPDIFPGIAIAISLVPPLSSMGIWLAAQEFAVARSFLVIFLSNLTGIVVGGLIVFSLLKFHTAAKRVQKRVAEAEAVAEAKKEAKEKEKAKEGSGKK